MDHEHMTSRPLYLRIHVGNSTRVEERQTWGKDGPERVLRAIARQYADEWHKDGRQGPPPAVSMISRQEYDKVRFADRL